MSLKTPLKTFTANKFQANKIHGWGNLK